MDIALSEGFHLFSAAGLIFTGWSSVLRGDLQPGIKKVRCGIDSWASTGAQINRPVFLYLLARSYLLVEEKRPGLAALEEATTLIEETNERWMEPELHRLRGHILNAAGDRAAAERNYRHGVATAERQSAKQFELRAGTSLAGLLRDQDRSVEARDLLEPIYAWFTEGFDAPDLVEAKALLGELAPRTCGPRHHR
jgi:predicted ATPase